MGSRFETSSSPCSSARRPNADTWGMKPSTYQWQRLQASVLGTRAFQEGRPRVPALDAELLAMFKGRTVGAIPEGEASTAQMLRDWLASWDAASRGPSTEGLASAATY